jgi:predicted AAA+ superfamily ATPase
MEKDFRQIVAEQREELSVYNQPGWVARDQEKFVDVHSRLAQIITGVRRSGKSTLAHRALQATGYAYINFDDERLSGIDSDSLNRLLEALFAVYGKFSHILFDEIQNVEGWHLFVNRLLRNNFRIILTGSNSKLLSNEMATHLTGRYATIELFPFSFHEYLMLKGMHPKGTGTAREKGLLHGCFSEYLTSGGFPEVVTGESGRDYIDNLFESIVTRDIFYRHDIRQTRTFRELALYLAGNYATEISYNRIKNIFGLGSENTAKNYVSYLEEAWLCICLPKFSFKKQESLRYRKIYLVDIAFAGVGGGSFTPNTGRLLENVVFLELSRNARRLRYELFYYKKNIQVDFVIYSNLEVVELIQVAHDVNDKKTLNREVRALLEAAKDLHAAKLTIITLDEKRTMEQDGLKINLVPVTEWLLENYDVTEKIVTHDGK